MGQRYRGPHQFDMNNQIELSRNYIDGEIRRLYPHHSNWFHLVHRGNFYHFYIGHVENRQPPARDDIDISVRNVEDFLFETEGQDQLLTFHIRDGQIAARIQIFNQNIELENMPQVVRTYRHLLHYGWRLPQFANILVILDNE